MIVGSVKAKPKRVYANMVADLFHCGHVNFLRQAAELGDELVVGIVKDELLIPYKREPVIPQHERAVVVRACCYVTEVIDGTPLVIDKEFMELHKIDIVVHGSDFTEEKMRYYFPYAYSINAVLLIPYTQTTSTTAIIRRIRERKDFKTIYIDEISNDIAVWL